MNKKFKVLYAIIVCFAILFCGTNISASTTANAQTPVQITFVANGGNCDTTTTTTDEDGKLASLPTATYSGYTFMGWFTSLEQDAEKVTTDKVYSEATTLYAKWANKSFSYTITNIDDESAKVVGLTNSSELTYDVILNATSNEDIISAITSDLSGTESAVTLNFENFNVLNDSAIELSFANATITGNISSSYHSPIFNIKSTKNSSKLTFKNLNLSGYGTIINYENTDFSADVTFNNVNITAENQEFYGFNLSSTNYSLTFREKFTHTNDKLFHFINNLKVTIVGDNKNGLSSDSNISATISYDVYQKLLMTDFSVYNNSIFSLLPTDDFYTTDHILNIPNYYGSSYIKISYDTNGGTFLNNDDVKYRFVYTSTNPTSLPVSDNISLNYNSFAGWFGKITFSDEEKSTYGLSENTYYFDKTCMQNLADLDFDLTKLGEVFKTNLSELNDAFSSFAYDETETDISFLAIKMFVTNKKTPTFIAKYNPILYSISFDTNGGSYKEPITGAYNAPVTAPTNPTKEGYDFVGWFKDEDLTQEYTFSTIPAENITLYAKWQIKTITLTFVHNTETPATSNFSGEYQTEITFPEIAKTGHTLSGWFTDQDLTNEFTSQTLPSENTTLYAKWTINKYNIFFNTVFGLLIPSIYQEYNSDVTAPDDPVYEGYTFFGWYTDTTYTTPYVFSKMPAKNITVYAQWLIKEVRINFQTNCATTISPIKQNYKTTVIAPATPVNEGYRFVGWFSDQALTKAYVFSTMPANDITLYAKWERKSQITLSGTQKTTNTDGAWRGYEIDSSLTGFVVQYKVDGNWTTEIPTEVGKYDVRIYRAEDDHYSEFSKEIKNGFVITANVINLNWLIILLFAIAVIELIAIFVVRRMRTEKIKNSVLYGVAFSFGTISTSQFVLLIISAVLALFGFVVLVYELVKLHRANPETEITPSRYDNQVTISKMQDKSEDKTIDSRVDEMLNHEFNVQEMQKELAQKNELANSEDSNDSDNSDNLEKLNDYDDYKAEDDTSNNLF